jgi:hypothetical protein
MEKDALCKQCILTDSTPGIEFDQNGVCNYCASHVRMNGLGEDKLREVLDQHKALKKKYDCMVCISGGRDSAYLLLKMVRDYGMKVLAVNYKNPFTSEQARVNIKRAVDLLKVDFVDWEFPRDKHRKATAKTLAVWSHRPSSLLIPLVCAHCKTTWPGFYKIAKENDISLIAIGSNPLETASFKKAGLGGARTYHKLKNLPNIIMKTARELAKNPRYLVRTSWPMVFKMYFMASHSSPYLRRRYKGIKVIRLYDYLNWSEKDVLAEITRKLGWQKSSEVASSWRFDCRLDYVRRLMYASTHGVTELRDLFSKMIREDLMTREEALERMKTEDVVPTSVANDVLSEIGMKLEDLNLKHVPHGQSS